VWVTNPANLRHILSSVGEYMSWSVCAPNLKDRTWVSKFRQRSHNPKHALKGTLYHIIHIHTCTHIHAQDTTMAYRATRISSDMPVSESFGTCSSLTTVELNDTLIFDKTTASDSQSTDKLCKAVATLAFHCSMDSDSVS